MLQSKLSIGTAKRSIPYPDDFFPYRAWGPRCLTGVHDDLCVRALYLHTSKPLLILVLDTGDIDPQWPARIADAVGLAADQILLSAIHTHTAPYIGGYWPEAVKDGEKSRQYTILAWNTVLAAAKQAMAAVSPASVRFATGNCDVNVNRDVLGLDPFSGEEVYTQGQNFHGYSDKTVHTICFEGPDGALLAVLFNYAVHSAILFGTNQKDGGQLASSDLAGAAMRHVEAAWPGCVALFAMAPAADQDARYNGAYMAPGADGAPLRIDYGMGAFALVDSLGRELASEVVSICRGGTEIPADEIRSAARVAWLPGKIKREGPGVPAPKSPDGFEAADPVPVPLIAARLGTIQLVGIGCEITSPIGAEIQNALRAQGISQTYLITQCNGSSSYLADDDAYQRLTFPAKASHMMPGAAGLLVQAVLQLVSTL